MPPCRRFCAQLQGKLKPASCSSMHTFGSVFSQLLRVKCTSEQGAPVKALVECSLFPSNSKNLALISTKSHARWTQEAQHNMHDTPEVIKLLLWPSHWPQETQDGTLTWPQKHPAWPQSWPHNDQQGSDMSSTISIYIHMHHASTVDVSYAHISRLS